ncbi:MAG: 3-dehydroquinate synthase II [Thermoplasmata archaeon]
MRRERIVLHPIASNRDERSEIVRSALAQGIQRFLIPIGDPDPPHEARDVYMDEGSRWRRVRGEGPSLVEVRDVRDVADLERAITLGSTAPAIALRWSGDRVIPLESVVAALHGRSAIWSLARDLDHVVTALGALEHGADHVVVDVTHAPEVARLIEMVDRSTDALLAWETVEVRRKESADLGDRVIVDMTSVLRPEEGLLVGSSAAFLFHLASEAVGSAFSRPRAFRVNAGAPHSYVLLADGTTRYLAELAPGDAVAVVVPGAPLRAARVGRLKIERRPLVLIEVDRDGRRPTVFVQDAETVRFSLPGGDRAAVTDLSVGQKVVGVALPAGRHLGAPIDESIEER